MIHGLDAWAIRRELTGLRHDEEMAVVTESVRPLIAHLAGLPIEDRLRAFGGYLCGRPDREMFQAAIEAADPHATAPIEEARPAFATAADVRLLLADTLWAWDGWIPAGRICGLAGLEGTGKTRTAMDLHRRAWHGLPAPDGRAFALETRRPALWLCADGQHDEIAQMLPAFGLPDEAVVFAATPDEPFEGVDLDVPEFIEPGGMLERAVAVIGPWCIFVDSLTYATSRNLSEQHVMKGLKAPLVRLAQAYGVTVCLMLHLSREGQALGRRIRGLTRTLIHIECPDPEGQPTRLRMWVEKSYAAKPPPLGLVLGPDGNAYDPDPPCRPDPNRGGRPPAKLEKAITFLVGKLSEGDRRQCELIDEWLALDQSKGTIFNAMRAMQEDGRLVIDAFARPKESATSSAAPGEVRNRFLTSADPS